MADKPDKDKEHKRLVRYIMGLLEKNPQWTVEQAKTAGLDFPMDQLISFIKATEGFDIDEEEWSLAVLEAFDYMERRVLLAEESELMTVSDSEHRLWNDPSNNHEYWNQYRELLESELGFDSAIQISSSCDSVLNRLSLESTEPVKGLVHGSVQSGKTSNMEGIITKAADAGFNVFIVFTGTLTTLNDQTEGRFRSDLTGKYQFTIVSPADVKKHPFIDPNAKTICVSMKTTAKLRTVSKWLSNTASRGNLKVLVIDDEADYASVNSGVSEEQRSITNRLMMELVNQNDQPQKFGAMNYIAFTATPYPNLLNESGTDSLYPHNFIISLPHADSYFGPQQIFGANYGPSEFPGLPVVNVSHDLDTEFRKLERGTLTQPTEELKESIAWFISAVAALRCRGYTKPLSFMINTTHNVDPHSTVAKAVIDYIDDLDNRPEIMEYCRIVYGQQTSCFNKDIIRENCPQYPEKLLGESPDYPEFDEIVPYIEELLSDKCHHIKDEDGNIKYYRTLHICVENSRRVNLEDDSESVYISRIRYPREGDECPPAPAFIIIGGNVLSRGLTLKGLITSFFLRPTTTADTLMQMGRWFGFRQGYELYPRIWMSERSYRDFCFLAQLDEEVREEIRECNRLHSTPEKTAIRLLAIPSAKNRGYLRSLCARNKMKSAVNSNVSFIGKYEEFAKFRNDSAILSNNMSIAKSFLCGLDGYGPHIPKADDWNVVRWNNVPSVYLLDRFLRPFRDGTDPDQEKSISLSMFIKWLEEVNERGLFSHWNILLAGTAPKNCDSDFTVRPDIRIGKISRSKADFSDKSLINIKTLRNRSDLFKDVFPDEFTDPYLLKKIRSMDIDSALRQYERDNEWVSDTPLLIIYCINKDSVPKARKGGKSYTVPLEAVEDVISFLVEVPNIDTQDNAMVQVNLDLDKIGEEDDI